jgi:cyclohexanone monooxygenase
VSNDRTEKFDAIVVGAGFAGMYMLHKLREQGLKVHVLEQGSGVGGTWYWNRYPGARCDVESLEYSYQFDEALQQEWKWSEKYSPQPEILDYANHVADRFDLRKDISFNTTVKAAHFNETESQWAVSTEDQTLTAQYCIMATGCLSKPSQPHFEGLETFEGNQYFTSSWPKEGVNFTDRRVGIIGTGSSAVQSIPVIADQAKELTVFQRTPNFSVPAQNASLNPDYERAVKSEYAKFRADNKLMQGGQGSKQEVNDVSALSVSKEERLAVYEKRWSEGGIPFLGAFNDLLLDKASNETAAEFIRGKIHEIVKDPETARLLSPQTVAGCKRLCVDTNYFATFNKDNVSLVDVNVAPIEGFDKTAIKTFGKRTEIDDIVFATGFDAMTGALLGIDIRGRAGLTLGEKWAEGPKTYLGLTTTGFPNLFTITGPGSPSVLTNMLPSIEQHVDWIADCIYYLDKNEKHRIEPTEEAEAAWVAEVNAIGDFTLFPSCNSWYLGANIPGKPRVFMPYLGFPGYVAKCEEVVAKNYEGFTLS